MQSRMKLNLVLKNFITIVCTFVTCQASYIPPASQYLQPYYPFQGDSHRYNRVHHKEDVISNEITGYGNVAKIYDYHSRHPHRMHRQQKEIDQHFNQLHLKQLTESAKDPKNLRNGIYHDGAITYDLGLPNYVVLNPYDPPEIITSNHPLYHEQMHHLKKTNNFTIEDFDVTSMPVGDDTISATASVESATTTYTHTTDNEFDSTTTIDTPETTTKAAKTTVTTSATATTTSAPAVVVVTPLPIEKYEIKENQMKTFLSKTKEKLQVLSNELQFKSTSDSNSSSPAHIISDLEHPNSTTLQSFQYHYDNASHEEDQLQLSAEMPIQQSIAMFPLQINKNPKFAKRFYGHSVMLPAGSVPNIQQAYLKEDKTKS